MTAARNIHTEFMEHAANQAQRAALAKMGITGPTIAKVGGFGVTGVSFEKDRFEFHGPTTALIIPAYEGPHLVDLVAMDTKRPTRFAPLYRRAWCLGKSFDAWNRFIVLTLTESFLGREDLDLINRLFGELPGIPNWAIDGWRRLNDRGYFIQPASSREAIQELIDLGSPVGAFLREHCNVGPGFEVERAELYNCYTVWCTAEGRSHPGTAITFGRDLRAAIPGIGTAHRGGKDGRNRWHVGVGLK